MELIETPANPAPPGAQVVGLRARDGAALRCAYWRPAGPPRGSVALIQGRAEFIEKYFEVVGELLSRGFVVAAFDWRGQGLSQRLLRNGSKGHVGSSTDYRLDLEAFLHQALAPDCPRPWYALAHSMGATILLDETAGQDFGEAAAPFERIVAVAPMLDFCGLPGRPFAHGLIDSLHGLGLGRLSTTPGRRRTLVETPFPGNVLTRDPARYQRAVQILRAAPALELGAPTIGWVHAAYRLMARVTAPGVAERIRTPALFLTAGHERLVSNRAIELFARRLKNAACVALPAAEHELMMERDETRAQFWAAFDAFIPGEPFLHKAQAERAAG
jgi:lysophospholipase